MMSNKPTRDELEQRIEALEKENARLRKAGENYREFFENAVDSIVVLDAEGRCLDLNKTFEEEIGRRREELIGRTLFASGVCTGAASAEARAALENTLRSDKASTFEMEGVRKNGGVVPFEARAVPSMKDGKIVALRTSLRNISDRKRRENRLRLTRFAMDHASDMAFLTTSDSRIIYANVAAAKRLGYSREKLRTMAVRDIDAGFTRGVDPEFWKELRTRRSFVLESRFKSGDGAFFPVEMTWNVIEFDGREYDCIFVRDITARKLVEEALMESEERLRTVIDHAPVVLWAIEPDGIFTFCAGRGLEAIGLSPGTAVGGSLFMIYRVHPRVVSDARRALAGEAFSTKTEFGDAIFEFRYTPLRTHDGLVNGAIAVAMDITRHARVEEALRASERELLLSREQLEATIRHAPLGIVTAAAEGPLLTVNQAFADMLGHTRDELLAMTYKDVTLPEDLDESASFTRKVWQSDGSRRFQTDRRYRRKDGSVMRGSVNATLVHDQEGRPLFTVVLVEDVSERKKTEEELLRLRNLLTNIINSMPSVLVGVDVNGRVTQWNHEAEKATRLPADRARGRLMTEVYPQLSGEMEKIWTAIRSGEVQRDARAPMKNGDEVIYSDVTVYPLMAGDVQGAVIRVDDVTERVRMEEMMIQSEKMLSLGGLAAGMAHEIKNPLGGVLQNIQVLNNRIFGNLPRNLRVAGECGVSMEAMKVYMEKRGVAAMVKSIFDSGKRAAKIIEDMLSFSRKSESRLDLVDLAELMDKSVALASKEYDLKKKYDFLNIKIIRRYDAATPRIPCEASKIQQVFFNILKNGAEAMNEAGVRDPRFTLVVSPDGDMARVEIEDNGPGMDPAVRNHIFEPFFTTKKIGLGTGLGLSVSYFIITENHGGSMTVTAPPGKGARFIIRLPFQSKK